MEARVRVTTLLVLFIAFSTNFVFADLHSDIARKLIKLFLAAAILSPPGLGVLPVPVPLPVPIGLEAIKPPVVTGPFPFHTGGFGPFGGIGGGYGGGGFG